MNLHNRAKVLVPELASPSARSPGLCRVRGFVGLFFVAIALSVTGCERADHPNRSVPEDFEATLLTGESLTRSEMKGPLVVNLWVPG